MFFPAAFDMMFLVPLRWWNEYVEICIFCISAIAWTAKTLQSRAKTGKMKRSIYKIDDGPYQWRSRVYWCRAAIMGAEKICSSSGPTASERGMAVCISAYTKSFPVHMSAKWSHRQIFLAWGLCYGHMPSECLRVRHGVWMAANEKLRLLGSAED